MNVTIEGLTPKHFNELMTPVHEKTDEKGKLTGKKVSRLEYACHYIKTIFHRIAHLLLHPSHRWVTNKNLVSHLKNELDNPSFAPGYNQLKSIKKLYRELALRFSPNDNVILETEKKLNGIKKKNGKDSIRNHHQLIITKLNEALLSAQVNLKVPMHYSCKETNHGKMHTISGNFVFPNGADHSWSYSAKDKKLSQLEREINLDLLTACFHNQISEGLIKTNHRFKISNINYHSPNTMSLIVSKKGFSGEYQVIKINLDEETDKPIYNFKTGELNVKALDEKIGELLPISNEKVKNFESDDNLTLADFILYIETKKLMENKKLEIESGIPLKPCQVSEPTGVVQMPIVKLTKQ